MKKCKPLLLLFVYLISFIPNIAPANGVSIGRAGHNIIPVANDSIKLVSELLKIHQNGSVEAHCWYLLKNIADTPQKLTIGFYVGDTALQHISVTYPDFRIIVDGKKQIFQMLIVKDEKTYSGAANYAVWDMFFYPQESKMIYVEQPLMWFEGSAEMGDLLGVSESGLSYKLSLAKEWAGSPERIEIYFDFGWDTGLIKDDTLWGISKLLIIKPDNFVWLSKKELMWSFQNTDSIEDISITIKTYDYKPIKEKILEQFLEKYNHLVTDDEFKEVPEIDVLYDADKRLYTENDMKFWSDVPILELKKIKNRYEVYKILLKYYPAFLRNLIYAYHGYKFKDDIWQKIFSKAIWYKPKESFNEAEFNDFERKNIAFIKKYEEKITEYLKSLD